MPAVGMWTSSRVQSGDTANVAAPLSPPASRVKVGFDPAPSRENKKLHRTQSQKKKIGFILIHRYKRSMRKIVCPHVRTVKSHNSGSRGRPWPAGSAQRDRCVR